MEEIKNNSSSINDDGKKDNNPLSVRVGALYKDVFEDLINKKGISKKSLMEAMISSYAGSELDKEREQEISFSNEISLISGLLEEMLQIFSTISRKSQDTVGSLKTSHKQDVNNLSLKISYLEKENSTFKERNGLLVAAQKGFELEKEKSEQTNEEFKRKNADLKKEIDSINLKNIELLDQINSLRKVEKDNLSLNNEIDKYKQDLKQAKVDLQDKIYEIESLKARLNKSENLIKETLSKREDEISEIIKKVKKETEIEAKFEILQTKALYNELQIEHINKLNSLNKKEEEIHLLKLGIEQMSKTYESG